MAVARTVLARLPMIHETMLAEVAQRAPREVTHTFSPSRRGFSLPAGTLGVGPVPHATQILGAFLAPVNAVEEVHPRTCICVGLVDEAGMLRLRQNTGV